MEHALPGLSGSAVPGRGPRPAADHGALAWLDGTHASAGVLGRWVGDPSTGLLQVHGIHDRTGDLVVALGDVVHVDDFPGPAEAALLGVWVVTPVGTDEQPWGVLALLEGATPLGSHEAWAALLAAGLDAERLAREHLRLEKELQQAALYDPVTGLPNRRLFLDRLSTALEHHARVPEARYAVVFLDLDGFKLVNDSLGHVLGDELLREVGGRLRTELRSADTGARFGGDEFAVLLTGAESDDVLGIAQRIQDRIAAPLLLAGQEVSVTASIGIATSESGYASAQDVLRDADTAMYQSKETQRGTATLFDPAMHARASDRLRLRAELRTALEEQQFVVHYQPIVMLDGAGVGAFEALVRWEHPERGLLLPWHFLPDMEDNPTIVTLGRWLVDEVCRQLAEWRRSFHGPLAVSVNISNMEFWSADLVSMFQAATKRHGVSPADLVIEITESVIMTDPRRALRIMNQLRALGHRLHVDDFGTGQSSLNALRTFPVDALKIDGAFVRELDGNRTAALVRAIVEMAAALGMDVIAECVETSDQADQLRAMGCGNAQGWLYARAVPGDEATRMLGLVLMSRSPV